MPNALEQYRQARKLALNCVSERKAEEQDPYLPVLDHYLHTVHVTARKDIGIQEILTDRIAGTVHEGRTESFAANFMPLLGEDSEFAAKWITLCTYAMDEGLRDPIKVYELFGRYFVEEGNKRVSVTKYLKNPLISARVIELTADPFTLRDGELYKAFLKFHAATGISAILMSKAKNYKKLLKIICGSYDCTMPQEQRKDLLSLFYSFEAVLNKLVRQPIQATSGDAFLMFLEVYGWQPDEVIPDSVIEKELTSILPAILAYPNTHKAALLTDTSVSDYKPFLSIFREPIKAALIQTGDPKTSSWSRMHYEAFKEMEKQMDGRVSIQIYENEDTPEKIERAFELAIADGAQVIFSSHPLMLQITNQFAAKYPKIHFLNCSLNPEASNVRTYYTRGYEIQFLQGMAAGALTTSGRIGYIADYPIYGAIADINAFAIGVSMVRPEARVYLEWSTTDEATNQDFPVDIDMIYIAGQDFDTRIASGKRFGLFDVRTGKFANLSVVHQKWGVFYTRILTSILNRSYKNDAENNGAPISYWLGLSNGLIDVSFSDALPFQTRRLIERIKDDMAEKHFFVFDGIHVKHKDDEQTAPISMEEVATMDWLIDNIVGTLPKETKLIPSAKELVTLHGLDGKEAETIDEVQIPASTGGVAVARPQSIESDETEEKAGSALASPAPDSDRPQTGGERDGKENREDSSAL